MHYSVSTDTLFFMEFVLLPEHREDEEDYLPHDKKKSKKKVLENGGLLQIVLSNKFSSNYDL